MFAPQVFLTQLPASASNTFVRLSNSPTNLFGAVGINPVTSESRKRVAFSLAGVEFGGGNSDSSTEVFYLLVPQVTAQSDGSSLVFQRQQHAGRGCNQLQVRRRPTQRLRPVRFGVTAGLAPGELVCAFDCGAASSATLTCASVSILALKHYEVRRYRLSSMESPGVNWAAAGLYFVGAAEKQITFVAPVGLAPDSKRGYKSTGQWGKYRHYFRGFVQIIPDSRISSTLPVGRSPLTLPFHNANFRTLHCHNDGGETLCRLSLS